MTTCNTPTRHPIRVFDLDNLAMLIGADTAGRMLKIDVPVADSVELLGTALLQRGGLGWDG